MRIARIKALSLYAKDKSMIVTFDKDYLRELYETGKGDKKHRFQPDIIKRYRKGIDLIKSANKVEDLFLLPSLRYEVLKGDKAGISSIRGMTNTESNLPCQKKKTKRLFTSATY